MVDPDLEALLLPNIWHVNPYCLHIKSNRARWDACIQSKQVLFRELRRADGAPVCGHCPFGVWEKSWPIMQQGKIAGAVSASAYRFDEAAGVARRNRTLLRYGAEPDEQLDALYNRHLQPRGATQIEAECQCAMLARALSDMASEGVIKLSPDPRRTHALVLQALDYIRSHIGENFSVPDVAAFCNISESHLQHLFQRIRGRSVIKTIVDIRLEHARQLLREGRLPVREVAGACGFSDPNYFSTVFANRYGLAPSRYRRIQEDAVVQAVNR